MCAVVGVPSTTSLIELPASPPTSSAAIFAASFATGIVPGTSESSVVRRPRFVILTRNAFSRVCITSRITVRSDQRRSQRLRANAAG